MRIPDMYLERKPSRSLRGAGATDQAKGGQSSLLRPGPQAPRATSAGCAESRGQSAMGAAIEAIGWIGFGFVIGLSVIVLERL